MSNAKSLAGGTQAGIGNPSTDETTPKRAWFGNIPVDLVSVPGAVARVDELAANGEKSYVCFCDANSAAHAWQDSEFARILAGATLVLPDGVWTIVAARCAGIRFRGRVRGPEFMLTYMEACNGNGARHFFYGGAPGVADTLAHLMKKRYPGLAIAGTFSPPFRALTADERKTVKRMIEGAGTTILWVGLGAPKQEFWMAEAQEWLNVPVMLGVGAAFDFHTGRRPWAPHFIRRMGMEWVFRMVTGGPRVAKRNLWCVFVASRIVAMTALRRAW